MSVNEQPKQEAEWGSEEDGGGQPAMQASDGGSDVPLFLRGISDGYKGDAQDEKDGVGE